MAVKMERDTYTEHHGGLYLSNFSIEEVRGTCTWRQLTENKWLREGWNRPSLLFSMSRRRSYISWTDHPPPPLNWRVYIALKACDLIRCQSSTFSCVFECFTVKVAAFSSSWKAYVTSASLPVWLFLVRLRTILGIRRWCFYYSKSQLMYRLPRVVNAKVACDDTT